MSIHLLRAKEIAGLPAIRNQHQFNENAIRTTQNLAQTTGMQRLGIHLVRIASGRDSTTHHFHDADEEFLYIISGRGIAKIADEEFDIGPGDFMGFPAPSPAHSLHNPYAEDLVYLMGGERWAVDIVHYPQLQRSMLKSHGRRVWIDDGDIAELPPRD
jgi:uncharacterized cupin superfamily protein